MRRSMHAMEDIVVIPSQDQTNHTSPSSGLKTGQLSKFLLSFLNHKQGKKAVDKNKTLVANFAITGTEYLEIHHLRDLRKILHSQLLASTLRKDVWLTTIWY